MPNLIAGVESLQPRNFSYCYLTRGIIVDLQRHGSQQGSLATRGVFFKLVDDQSQ
jgi:hypothetical protein